jgi:hypothetical protein
MEGGSTALMPSPIRSRSFGLSLAVIGATLAIAMGACGGEEDDGADRPTKPPGPHTAGRFESPQYIFTSKGRPPTRRVTISGKRLRGGRDYLLIVRIRLANRKRTPLQVGLMSADLRDRRGRSFEPVLADGREATEPVFAEPTAPPSSSIDAQLVYRLPLRAIAGADLRVTDPVRKQTFELSVY